jgi:hypothetical protein
MTRRASHVRFGAQADLAASEAETTGFMTTRPSTNDRLLDGLGRVAGSLSSLRKLADVFFKYYLSLRPLFEQLRAAVW